MGTKILAAIGSKDRRPTCISSSRLEQFDVHGQPAYRTLVQDIPKHPLWPTKPNRSASSKIKAQCRTDRAQFIVEYVDERDMLLTYLYYRWMESPTWQRDGEGSG